MVADSEVIAVFEGPGQPGWGSGELGATADLHSTSPRAGFRIAVIALDDSMDGRYFTSRVVSASFCPDPGLKVELIGLLKRVETPCSLRSGGWLGRDWKSGAALPRGSIS
jgi:hypothetical protein